MNKEQELRLVYNIGIFSEVDLVVLGLLSDQTGLSPIKVLKQALKMYQLELSDVPDLPKLASENDRLLAGDFTPTEFQNLCHKFSTVNREAFFDGCAEYQRKLFGIAERDLDKS